MFEFSAGSPSLCLVDTIGNRGGARVERLVGPEDFTRWLRAASLLGIDGRDASEADLADARALREALYESAIALSHGSTPRPSHVELINALARNMPPRPQWLDGRVIYAADDEVRSALALLAADAVAVLADSQIGRVRLCPGCRMMFVDRSPGGKRRWCASASGCGNRAKVRDHRARRMSMGNRE